MAGAQFFASERPAPPRPTRRFTLEQANKALPLVQRIVADIVAAYDALGQQRQRLARATGREVAKAEQTLHGCQERLEDLLVELAAVGVELKDPAVGLVDFVSRHEGRDVYLCWKLGEERIAFWHEIDAGFSGRKPVSQFGRP